MIVLYYHHARVNYSSNDTAKLDGTKTIGKKKMPEEEQERPITIPGVFFAQLCVAPFVV